MNKVFRALLVAVLAILACLPLSGCSGGDSFRYDPGIPAPVTDLQTISGVNLVTLSWKKSPKAGKYNIYYVSDLVGSKVTKANAIKVSGVDNSPCVVSGLDNNVKYHFMVTAVNGDGESAESPQVSETPGPITPEDLNGTWYFHTLVTGPDAKWERGTLTVTGGTLTGPATAVISRFEDSAGNTQTPQGFIINAEGNGKITQSGTGAWTGFHGVMGSRKEMIAATFSPTLSSRAITIFQRKRDVTFSIADIMGTGSGQNPNDPNLNGNGPTRFTYHQIYSGASTEWEYCNGKVGQNGQYYTNATKDITYWDFANPAFKSSGYDFFWKATSFGIDGEGLVTEYWNFTTVVDPAAGIADFNRLTPKQAHAAVFTGRMTADKTVVVGVSTITDAYGLNPKYFMRIMELCFKPADQSLPTPDLEDLAGVYKFHKLGYSSSGGGAAAWAYGEMVISASGATAFPGYTDSLGNVLSSDSFTLSYYPDPNPDGKLYRDFANFTSAALDGHAHYLDANGDLLRTYYDFSPGYVYNSSSASYGIDCSVKRRMNVVRDAYNNEVIDPATNKPMLIIPNYYNEHATLSLIKDLVVMTRTDASGYGIIVGLK